MAFPDITDYTMIVCEKPDAARKIAAALAENEVRSVSVGGVEVLSLKRKGESYIVCSALGHLFGVSDPFETREVYPVFDLEWYPTHVIQNEDHGIRRRIDAIRRVARGAKGFVNACDYDAEGGTIGENILRYVCGCLQGSVERVKFSTLTKEELLSAFEHRNKGAGAGLSVAGRTRHVLDFLWGVNLSRVLSISFNTFYPGYKTISMGRVQGPTLHFVVERELEIRSFVPTPYWTMSATFEKDGMRFQLPHLDGKFKVESLASSIKEECESGTGLVSAITRAAYREKPLAPFDTSDLQREAYRAFGYQPSRTLQIAQRLYLDAVISYPRTGSQKLPPSIGYESILSALTRMEEYSGLVSQLTGRGLCPREGYKSDPAHPAIYPTGELLRRPRSSQEGKVFDLIVRRFLSCFAEDAIREKIDLRVDVGHHAFGSTGRRTLSPGWMRFYGRYSKSEEVVMPKVEMGDSLSVISASCEEKMEQAPQRYNQSSLLGKMEKEGIGTKATRAEVISTLLTRGYISGERLAATELGIAVVEGMREHCAQIISTELTREIEAELEKIETRDLDGKEIVERAINLLSAQLGILRKNTDVMGGEINKAVRSEATEKKTLGGCPICRKGTLMVIRSRKTRKRFVGCSEYSNGCRASAPLPQRGSVRAGSKPCPTCGWPVVYVNRWRHHWRFCVNMKCKSRKGNERNVV